MHYLRVCGAVLREKRERAKSGGDDFVETLPWARKLKALIDGGARIITLRMTRDSIEIVHDRAPDRTRRKL